MRTGERGGDGRLPPAATDVEKYIARSESEQFKTPPGAWKDGFHSAIKVRPGVGAVTLLGKVMGVVQFSDIDRRLLHTKASANCWFIQCSEA